jgi:hypothetical protein
MAAMAAPNDLLSLFTAFRVDGQDYPGGPMTWKFHHWVGGMFTADSSAVAERLPAPDLCPLRWRPGRALLMVEGADLHQYRNGLPPTRGAFVAVSAMVTIGPEPAPALLPLLSEGMQQRYRVGAVPLRFLMTNHVEAQLFTRQFGFDMRTTDIERRPSPRHEQYACSLDGRPVIRLRVRTDGRLERVLPVLVFYSVRDGQPFRMSMSNPDPGATRLGRNAAVLDLADHEAVADLQGLRIAPTSWMGVSKPNSHWHADTPPTLLGPIRPPTRPAATDLRAARFTERLDPNRTTQIDQELHTLPFDPNSTIEVPQLPTSQPVG